jgi:heptosyltransferase-1
VTTPQLHLPHDARILIIKLSAVGDIVHALPCLTALRRFYPAAHIGWVVHPASSSLLETQADLNELIIFPRRNAHAQRVGGWRKAIWNLRKTRWDIDLQGLTKSGLIARLSGAPQRLGFSGANSREFNRLFMTATAPAPSLNIIQQNLDLLAPLGIPAHDYPIEIVATNDEAGSMTQWCEHNGISPRSTVCLDPFAGWESKTWPHERWAEVSRRLWQERQLPFLVFHGPGQTPIADTLVQKLNAAGAQAKLAPPTNLREFAFLVSHAGRGFLGGDTGPTHIAAAMGVPTVALFGPSASARNTPNFAGARVTALQPASRPCTGQFKRTCPTHLPCACMMDITPDLVVEAALHSFV